MIHLLIGNARLKAHHKRVDGHIYDPCIPGFDISYGFPRVLDGTRMDGNMHEAILVQSNCPDTDNVWQGVDDWGTIERFKLNKTDLRRSTGFVQYQSGHYVTKE